MGTCAGEPHFSVSGSINEKPVGLYVAFTPAFPFTFEAVVAVIVGKPFATAEHVNNSIEMHAIVLATRNELQVLLKGTGEA